MAQAVDPRVAARDAAARNAWDEAYGRYADLDDPGPEDFEAQADAAYLTLRLDEARELRERAHSSYLARGDAAGAARTALRLAGDFLASESVPRFLGWLATGERLLADQPETVEHGRLELMRAFAAEMNGDSDAALGHVEHALELGRRFDDRDLVALGLTGMGRQLLRRGELDRALAMLDEAATSAVSGALDPFCSCLIYCATISSARHVGDFERARHWTDAANRWCERTSTKGFPGACRVHRSEILGLEGDWDGAEQEAASACTELAPYDPGTTAAGFYQIGEIRRRRGDFAAAEEAYRRAHELGSDAQPGLALLRLAQGKVAQAVAGLRRALDDKPALFARARRLPAQVEISLAAGDVEAARAAVEELEEITDSFKIGGKRTPLLSGALETARGQIELHEGRAEEAARHLRAATAIWTTIGAPYEAASARMLLGMAYSRQGDDEGAEIEFSAAKAVFERLGAVLDLERAKELLGESETRRTFVFTDIVDSTKLLDALGDDKWRKLLDRHDALLRAELERAGGEVIKQTGDGFFAAFDAPAAAVEAAVAVQRALDDELLRVRVGIHSGEALERGDDWAGRGVNVAARIGAVAGPGEILASRETLDGVGLSFAVTPADAAELKGFAEPVELVGVDWR